MKNNNTINNKKYISFGEPGLVGQPLARQRIQKIIRSNRISHAYLFSGPKGTGKKAFAIAFAEFLNGVSNLTDLGDQRESKKSSWFTHPDIHLFIPMPSSANDAELSKRLQLLAKDAYEIVDFSLRPSLTDDESSKNLRAFYPIKYFRNTIKPVSRLKPNEGKKTVIIISNIEQMRKESANAFLKLLEEPSDNVIFLLTCDNQEALLPTIISRCQLIRMSPLKSSEIEDALVENDGYNREDASYLARLSGGNYSITKFYDIDTLKVIRESVMRFLRMSYSLDATHIIELSEDWHNNYTRENQIAILNTLEMLLRDLMVYRETQNKKHVTNIDQLNAIEKFTSGLPDARLASMLDVVSELRQNLYQNVQGKFIFTVLAIRFFHLIRDRDLPFSQHTPWNHIPAYIS